MPARDARRPGPAAFQFVRLGIRTLAAPFFTVEVRGAALPAGAYVGAFNHSSALDIVAMAKTVREPCSFFAKAELGRNPLLGPLLWRAGGVFVERGGGDAAAVEEAVALLRAGRPIFLAPEGTRHHGADGRARAHTGFVRLAQLAEVPVVPVAISGAREALPPGRRLPRPGRLRVAVGEAIRLAPTPVDLEHLDALQEQADAVLAEIYRLKAELEG